MAPVIALAGFMGSGKTTVGRRAAELLQWDFVDLDDRVEQAAGQTIPELFAGEGEAAFRRKECEVLRDLLGAPQRGADEQGTILALGGGTVTMSAARECLRAGAVVVYLQTSAEEAWRRVSTSDRPLARDREEFAALLAARRSTYEEAADYLLATEGKSVEELAQDIVRIARTAEARA